MITESRKITQKGQVTIPKEIRAKLGTTTVYFEVIDDDIIIRGVKDAAGSLHQYAQSAGSMSMKQMKEKAWEESVREKVDKTSS